MSFTVVHKSGPLMPVPSTRMMLHDYGNWFFYEL